MRLAMVFRSMETLLLLIQTKNFEDVMAFIFLLI